MNQVGERGQMCQFKTREAFFVDVFPSTYVESLLQTEHIHHLEWLQIFKIKMGKRKHMDGFKYTYWILLILLIIGYITHNYEKELI